MEICPRPRFGEVAQRGEYCFKLPQRCFLTVNPMQGREEKSNSRRIVSKRRIGDRNAAPKLMLG
jgi:hypothetical protein